MRTGVMLQDIGDLAREDPLWTSPDHPVVCWPLHGEYQADVHHSHPDLEAAVILKGVQETRYADAELECRPGDVWFAASGERHSHHTSAPVTNICIAFAPDFLGDAMLGDHHWLAIFAQPPARRPKVQVAEQRSNVLSTGWQMYREAATRRPGWEAAIRIHLLQVLLTLAREWVPNQRPSARPGDLATLLPALETVCTRAKQGQKVSTSEAASACAMSRSHFCRTFRRLMARSFGQFEIQTRLGVAARLLSATDRPVKDIAVRTGFHDGSHLHRHFLAHHGLTPRMFRKAIARRRTGR
jgi:AraC-like DNA-binding protein